MANPSAPSVPMKKIIDFTCIERYTECSLCLEQFKEPRILPCSHTYCTVCLIKMTNNNQDQIIKCPQCMVVHKIDPNNSSSNANSNCYGIANGGIYTFPKNLALEQLLEIKPTELISSKMCDLCGVNYAFTKCLHCMNICCLECKDKHRMESKDKLNKLFENLIFKSNLIVNKLKSNINQFLFNCNNLKINLNQFVNLIISEIKCKEDSLYKNIDNIIEEKLCWFKNLQTIITNENNLIKSLLDESTKAIKDDSISDEDLVKYENEYKKHINELNNIVVGSFSKKYEIEFESLFMNNLKNIEDFILSNIGKISVNEKDDDISEMLTEVENEVKQTKQEDHVHDLFGISEETKHLSSQKQQELSEHATKKKKKSKLKRNHSNITPSSLSSMPASPEVVASQPKLMSNESLPSTTPAVAVASNEIVTPLPPSSSSSSLASTPLLTPPESPVNLGRKLKTNYDLVKEKGLWAGDENLDYWNPSGVAINIATNEIIVADSWNHRLIVRNPENTKTQHVITSTNGMCSKQDGEFNNPRGVCCDMMANNLVVCDSSNHRIQIFCLANYQYKYKFGKYGSHKGEFINPIGIACDSKSQIYVCDRNNHRIQVFSSNGIWLTDWGSRGALNTQFEYPEYLCVSPINYLLVSDTGNNRIQVFNLDTLDTNSSKFGTFITSFGAFGDQPGYFNVPRGITTDNDGFIMIADCNNNRLQLFEPNGDFVREISEKSSAEFNYPINFDRPVAIYATQIGGLLITEWGRSHRLQIF